VDSIFYVLSPLALALALIALFTIAIEIGFRFGRLERSRDTDAAHSLTGVLQSALLGLLALLLGFTFSMAAARHDARQSLVIEEANAIGTAYLRTQLLSEPTRTQAADLLSRYLDARLYYLSIKDPDALAVPGRAVDELQRQVWSTTERLEDVPTAPKLLYVQSLNAVIDEQGKRSAAFYNRVPAAALTVLVLLAAASLAVLGYGAGLAGRRSTMCWLTGVLVVVVVLLIIDLDRPRTGLVVIDERSLVQLRDHLRQGPVAVRDKAESVVAPPRPP
jgi:hypothetical protein